eukprot:1131124-Pleurochrysis_carterae.AAC.1
MQRDPRELCVAAREEVQVLRCAFERMGACGPLRDLGCDVSRQARWAHRAAMSGSTVPTSG